MSNHADLMTSTLWFSLVLLSNGQIPPNDLACPPHHHLWTVVAAGGDWEFPNECTYANIDAVDGAMTWIGDKMPSSRNWTNYTLQAKMFVNDTSGGNGGVAFHIQDVGDNAQSGHYYAIYIFPGSYSSEYLVVNLGKWNNSVNNQYQLAQYRLNNTWTSCCIP